MVNYVIIVLELINLNIIISINQNSILINAYYHYLLIIFYILLILEATKHFKEYPQKLIFFILKLFISN